MKYEILFLVEEDPEGGYTARAMHNDFSIYTEGDTIDELKKNIIDSVGCHFDDTEEIPGLIRLHFVRDEVIHYAPVT